MAFLTKTEQTIINLLNANKALSADERAKMVGDLSYNARLRQDGNRGPVREFLGVLARHQSVKMVNSLKK